MIFIKLTGEDSKNEFYVRTSLIQSVEVVTHRMGRPCEPVTHITLSTKATLMVLEKAEEVVRRIEIAEAGPDEKMEILRAAFPGYGHQEPFQEP